jgi:magnesium-transporting ATPase (P-type)
MVPQALTVAEALAAYFFVLDAGGWRYGEALGTRDPLYLQATTACLAAIVVMQVVNVFLCRDPGRGFFSNPLLWWGIAFELALIAAIVYTPWGQRLFGTAALPFEAWLFMLPFAVAMLGLDQLRRLVVRR